ncbi:MAG: DUF4339 domain-containing protein [Bdellovibrionota bacterium]
MTTMNKYFLARSGKIAGPYSEEDLRVLEKRGELLSYSWIWTPGASDWKSIDPKPTRKPSFEETPLVAQSTDAVLSSSEAYALWGQNAIKGRVQARTELGFELVYTEHRMLPQVARGMSLQVMDIGDGSSNAHLALMKVSEIERKGEHWVLFLRH